MAINVDSFHTAFNNLDVNLRDQLYENIHGDRSKIISNISEIVNSHFQIREDLIESYVLDNFIQPLEYFQNSLADQVSDKVDTITRIVAKDSESEPLERVSSKFTMLINELSRDINPNHLESIKSDFLTALTSFLYRHGATDFLSSEQDERKIEEVRYETRNYLTRLIENYFENTKKAIKAETSAYREMVTFEHKVTFTPEDIKNRMFLGAMSHYQIKNVDGTYMFEDQLTEERFPLVKNGENCISTPDGYLSFQYGANSWSFTEGDVVKTVDATFVALGTKGNPRNMQINFGFDEVKFMYNGVLTNDAAVIKYICDEFKNKCPEIYARELNLNTGFKSVEEKVTLSSKENELYVVDESGITSIKDDKMAEVNSYLAAVGYTIEKKSDGYYLTDQAGISKKANISRNTITLDDGISITFDLYRYLKKGAVKGPEIFYKSAKQSVSAFIDQRFDKLSVFIGDNLYSLRVNGDNIEARSLIEGITYSDVDVAINKVGALFPNAINRLKNMAKSNKLGSIDAFQTDIFGDDALGEEEKVVDNASMFLTDADIAKMRAGGETDTRTKEEIHAANESAFKDSTSGYNSYQDMLEETENTVEEKVAEEAYTSLEEVNDRLFILSQDPKVQEYLNLLKKAEELKAIDDPNTLRAIL